MTVPTTLDGWKKAIVGPLNSLSTALLGAGIIPGLTDVTFAHKVQPFLIAGFVIKAAAEFFHGWSESEVKIEKAEMVVFPNKQGEEIVVPHIAIEVPKNSDKP